MKKICLTVVGMYITLFAGFGQASRDTAQFKPKTLTFEEANIVSSYYHQDGNNSSVTGGVGTEKLTDIANSFDIKLYNYDRLNRKHTWNLDVGVDHYTSASSDKVDLKANSSASYSDTRFYPSLNWTVENEAKRTTWGAGAAFSREFDYQSVSFNVNYSKKTANKMGEFYAKAQAYFDQVNLVLPTELIPVSTSTRASSHESRYPTTPRNSFDASLSYSQIINKRLQVMLLVDAVLQQGYLSLPFHRVYFQNRTVHQENLPDTRAKLPIGFRANYFLGDHFILRSFYRYYMDNWGLKAHTANIEAAIKITPFVSVSPFYRYYQQTAVDYFAPILKHTVADKYYTSNYDLSQFKSSFYGAGIRLVPPNGVLGMQNLNMLELRYGHYSRTNGLNSDVISLNLKFK